MSIGLKKGTFIFVKAPPYYEKEYLYEVTSAGDKIVRACLAGSSKVKKSWSLEEMHLLLEMGMVRVTESTQK